MKDILFGGGAFLISLLGCALFGVLYVFSLNPEGKTKEKRTYNAGDAAANKQPSIGFWIEGFRIFKGESGRMRLTAEEVAAEVARLCQENGVEILTFDNDPEITFAAVDVDVGTVVDVQIRNGNNLTAIKCEPQSVIDARKEFYRAQMEAVRATRKEFEQEDAHRRKGIAHLTELRHSPAPADSIAASAFEKKDGYELVGGYTRVEDKDLPPNVFAQIKMTDDQFRASLTDEQRASHDGFVNACRSIGERFRKPVNAGELRIEVDARGREIHVGCGGEVMRFEEGAICGACGKVADGDRV